MSIKELWSHWELSARILQRNCAIILQWLLDILADVRTALQIKWFTEHLQFSHFASRVFPPLASLMKISLNFSSFLPKKIKFFLLSKIDEILFCKKFNYHEIHLGSASMQMQNIGGQRWGQPLTVVFFDATESRRVVWAAYLSRCRPSLKKKLREIFQCDFSLENHKNESLIMRDSLRAQLWAWQSYRPEHIYIYLRVSVCVT